MITRRFIITSVLLVLLLTACTGITAAKEIRAENAFNVQSGTIAPLGVFADNASLLNGFTLVLTYDSTVMSVVYNDAYEPYGFSVTPNPSPGSITVSGITATVSRYISGTGSLFGMDCTALKNDGSSTPLTVTITQIRENGIAVTPEYTAVNGLFTTKDEVAPAITITNPLESATVPNDVMVSATITDVGGVDQSTISVTVGGVQIPYGDLTISTIDGGCIVSGTRTGVLTGSSTVVVTASDFSGNQNIVTHTVTVAESGITFNPKLDGTYTNVAEPVVKADYVQVDGTTVKMFINNIDVTAQATLTPSSPTAGSIELDYTAYGALADGEKTIIVNGTSSLLGGGVLTATETFVKDTVAPVVAISSIADSDTDGFPEAGETLTIAYTVTDANPDRVYIDSASSTTPTGNLVYGVAQGNALGNRNANVYAVDKAGNVGQSASFHIYNNYLAYIDEPTAGTFAGLDLTKTSTYNYFEPSVARAITISGHSGSMDLPTLGALEKTVLGGSNVIVDNRANNAVPAGTLPAGVPYFINPAGTLNFAAAVPNVDNATLIIGKANSTMIDQILRGGSVSGMSIEEILSKDKVVIYGKGAGAYGYRLITIKDDGTAEELAGGKGTFTFNTDLSAMIRANYIDLRSGFNTATNAPELGLEISKIGAGEYVLIAVTLDNDRVSVITAMPFVVTEEASQFTTSAESYIVNNPVVMRWGGAAVPQNLAGVIIRDSSVYTGNMSVDLTTLGTGSLRSMYLFGDGDQTVKKLINKANIWISVGYGNAANIANANTLNIPTTGLLPGTYTVHMMNENGGKMTAYGTKQITITNVGPTPTYYRTGGGSGGSSVTPVQSFTSTGVLQTGADGITTSGIIVSAADGLSSLSIGRLVKALDANGKPLDSVTINSIGTVPPTGSSKFTFAGHAVEMGPSGATFSPAIQLTFKLTEEEWNNLAAGESFFIKWYNEARGEWEDIPTSVNPNTHTVTGQISHFSTFALFTQIVESTGPDVTQTPTQTGVPGETTTPTPPGDGVTDGFPWVWIIVAIVLIALVGGGYYYMQQKK